MITSEIREVLTYPHKLGHFLGMTKLSDIHSYWIRQFWMNDYLLMAHRNSYKTTSVIVVGYIWYSLLYPEHTVLLIREETKNAEKTLMAISDILKSEKMRYLYRCIYGIEDFQLRKDISNSIVLPTKKKVTIEGSLDCVGIGTSITGRHYDKVAGDDIVTINDRVSPAKRERKIQYVMELLNIMKTHGSMSISNTPWHRMDALTHIEKKNIVNQTDRFPIGSIQITDLTEEKINKLKRGMTASLWAANYELEHRAGEDQIFQEINYDHWPEGSPRCFLDPAYKGNNTTALAMGVIKGKILHVRGWVWPEHVASRYKDIVKILQQYHAGTIWIESNADQEGSLKDMRKLYTACQGHWAKGNKHYRILNHLKKNYDYVRFAYDCQPEFLNAVLDYEEGKEPDDVPDSIAGLIEKLRFNIYDDDAEGSAAMSEDFDYKFAV